MGLDVDFYAKESFDANRYENICITGFGKSFYPIYKFVIDRIKARDVNFVERDEYEVSMDDLLATLDFIENSDLFKNKNDTFWYEKFTTDFSQAIFYKHNGYVVTMYVSY